MSLLLTFVWLAAAEPPLTVHAVVLLADSIHQGIVPVPGPLGDGQSPETNLYWGARYGVKTFFGRRGWRALAIDPPEAGALERRAWTRRIGGRPVVLVAEAWDGRHGRAFLERYLTLLSGDAKPESLRLPDGTSVSAGPGADAVVYIGHNVLMDFDPPSIAHLSTGDRKTAILACQSRDYFNPILERLGGDGVVLTTGNMAPEAYTLFGFIDALARGASAKTAVATQYAAFQKIPVRSAQRLFVGP